MVKKQKTIPVVYNPGVSNSYTNVNGSIETFNKESNKFTHIAYIKPMNGNQSNTVSVTGTLTEGSNLAGGQPTVKVYEYLGKKMNCHKVFMQIHQILTNSKM